MRAKEHEYFGSIMFLVLLIPIYFISIFWYFSFDQGKSLLVTGIIRGSFYALLAVGFSIIFGVARMLKLSLGGYFVLGGFTAFWINKVFEINASYEVRTPISDSTRFSYKLILYLPIISFFIVLVYLIFYDKKLGITQTIIQLLLFLIHRQFLVSNYQTFGFTATYHSFIIQLAILLLGASLIYLELSKIQVFIGTNIVNLIILLLNSTRSFPRSPALFASSLILSVLFVALVSIAVDRYILDKGRSNPVNVLIITFGIALLIQNFLPIVKYPDNGKFTKFDIIQHNLEGIIANTDSYMIIGVRVQALRVIATSISIILLILVYLFIKKTDMGRAMEAVSQDPDAAWLVGINVRKIYQVATGLGMGLTAAAAVLTTSYEHKPFWGINMGWVPLIFAIAVVTLGGIGSIPGSAIAGFIVGYTEVTTSAINIQYSGIVPLIVIAIIMIIRPDGLFGIKEDE